jgi:hypothetical protein
MALLAAEINCDAGRLFGEQTRTFFIACIPLRKVDPLKPNAAG